MTPIEMANNILAEYSKLTSNQRSAVALDICYGYDLSVTMYSLIPNLGDSDGYGFDESRQCDVLYWTLMNPEDHLEVTEEENKSKMRERTERQYQKILKCIENLKNYTGDFETLFRNHDEARQRHYKSEKAKSDSIKYLIIPALENAIAAVGASELGIDDPKYSQLNELKGKFETDKVYIEIGD